MPSADCRHLTLGFAGRRELDAVIAWRGKPAVCVSDNGTELTSMAMPRWSQQAGVEWHYIAPGKPQQNAFIESFNGRLRDELLNETLFASIALMLAPCWPLGSSTTTRCARTAASAIRRRTTPCSAARHRNGTGCCAIGATRPVPLQP